MKLRILTWLLVGSLASGFSYARPKQHKPPKPHYHCMCGDICVKAAAGERCKLKHCNGKDARRTRPAERSPSS